MKRLKAANSKSKSCDCQRKLKSKSSTKQQSKSSHRHSLHHHHHGKSHTQKTGDAYALEHKSKTSKKRKLKKEKFGKSEEHLEIKASINKSSKLDDTALNLSFASSVNRLGIRLHYKKKTYTFKAKRNSTLFKHTKLLIFSPWS